MALRARLGIGLLSIAGTAIGHYLTYLIAAPDNHTRYELLTDTGHTGESPFVILAIAALLGTCVAVLARPTERLRTRVPMAAAHLFVLQVGAFLGLELVERLGAQADLGHAAAEPVIWLGILVQLVVALAGAYVLSALRSAATAVAARPPLPTAVQVAVCLGDPGVRPTRGSVRAWKARGPPSSS